MEPFALSHHHSYLYMKYILFFLSFFFLTGCWEFLNPYDPPEMNLEGTEEPESIMDEIENVVVTEDYQPRQKQREEMGSIMDEMEDTDDIRFMAGNNFETVKENSVEEESGFELTGQGGIVIEADGTTKFEGFEKEQ